MADADADVDERTQDPGEGSGESDEIDDLVARVAAADEILAAEVDELKNRVEELETDLAERIEQIDELKSRLKRERADFKNYKKRAKERESEIRERATEDLVERLLDVRDNLVRALEQEADADIRDGVEATLSTFDRILEDENVGGIEPSPGDDVDPERHEVVMRVDDGDQPDGTIEEVYRPGYTLAGTVVRPAQVAVSATDE